MLRGGGGEWHERLSKESIEYIENSDVAQKWRDSIPDRVRRVVPEGEEESSTHSEECR